MVRTSRSRAAVAWMVAAGLALGAVSNAQAGSRRAKRSRDELAELNAHAQERYEAGDYEGAALAWATILETRPETKAARVQRATHMLIIIDTSLLAYDERREQAKERDERRAAMECLQRAVRVLEAYETGLVEAYGEGTEPHAEILSGRETLLERLAEAERELGPPPPPPAPPAPVVAAPPAQPRAEVHREAPNHGGTDLLVGGSLLMAAGAAGAVVVGTVAPRLEGARRTDFLVPGIVGSAGFVAGGVAMVVVGAKRRRLTVAPNISAAHAGISLAGRF